MIRKVGSSDTEHELYKWHAEMCKVFSHPTRLEILNVLRHQEMAVSELAKRLGVAIGNLSQDHNMMKQRRVLTSRKEANNVYYRLADPKVLRAFDLMRGIRLEQMAHESVVGRLLERSQARS